MAPTVSAVLATIGVVAVLATLLGSCASVGRGSATLITAAPKDNANDFKRYFPDLVTDAESMRPLTPGASIDRDHFTRYLEGKLGSASCQTSQLSVVVRDRTKIPPFLPVDVSIEKLLLPIYLDKDLPSDKKEKLADEARASTFNVPDLPNRTALHEISGGAKQYFYYPRVQVDFSSKLNSPSDLDRFAYLGIVLRLRESSGPAATNEKSSENAKATCSAGTVRIIDFQPKAADIVEFTRGELTQKAQLDAKASMSDQNAAKLTGSTATGVAGQNTTQTSRGSEQSQTSSLTPDLSLSMSETFVNALKDSIEARTAGLLEEGQVFFADFKAIKNRRIGGTYTFDVMMEMPTYVEAAKSNDKIFSSVPCATEIRADAYLVAVVRHVYKRGFTGWWTKVPEPDNDRAYYQVAMERVPDIPLWKHSGVAWINMVAKRSAQYTISVITNRTDARYVVKSLAPDGAILGDGLGQSSQIVLPSPSSTMRAHVEFLDVIDSSKDPAHVFAAQPSIEFVLEKETEGKITVVGTYHPTTKK